MTPKTAADLFTRAETLLERHAPSMRVERVPAGLAIAGPVSWPDGDPVALYLVPSGEGLRLVDDGCVVPTLDASGQLPEDGSWRRRLEAAGFGFDDDAYEVFAEVPDLDALPDLAASMARTLLALATPVDGGA